MSKNAKRQTNDMNTAKKLTNQQQIVKFLDFIFHEKPTASTIFWESNKPAKAWTIINPNQSIADFAASFANKTDVYYCPNQFFNWRLDKNLHKMSCLYVDVDCHELLDGINDDYERSMLIMKRLVQTEDKLERKGIPKASGITYSGRGFHLYWRINTQKGFVARKYQTALRELARICDADMQCCDTTRMLRLPYTFNSKTATLANFEIVHYHIYDFDELCDAILPLTKEELIDIRAIRARKNKPFSHDKKILSTIYNRWYLVHQDILKIAEYHNTSTGIPVGARDTLLFHLINSLSWFIHADGLEAEVMSLVNRFFPSFTVKQALSYCSSVIKRAKKTVGGSEFRYKYKRETLYDELSHLIPKDLALKAIVPTCIIEERREKRKEKRRAEAGALQRSEYEHRAKERFNAVVQLAKSKLSYPSIAKKLGISLSLVKQNMMKAKKKGLLRTKFKLSILKQLSVKVRFLYSLRSKGFFVQGMGAISRCSLLLDRMLFFPLKINKKRACPQTRLQQFLILTDDSR